MGGGGAGGGAGGCLVSGLCCRPSGALPLASGRTALLDAAAAALCSSSPPFCAHPLPPQHGNIHRPHRRLVPGAAARCAGRAGHGGLLRPLHAAHPARVPVARGQGCGGWARSTGVERRMGWSGAGRSIFPELANCADTPAALLCPHPGRPSAARCSSTSSTTAAMAAPAAAAWWLRWAPACGRSASSCAPRSSSASRSA